MVHELMSARREVKQAKASDDPDLLKTARSKVNAAKVALGERGAVWWNDGSPDYNRWSVLDTPYADWASGWLE
ncbi:hypothetical protein [Pseudomonas capsici]|uniref:hypothetical protein n=1 Tax=Pseudomonas capsici TaxID=2810614 RepID=UPI00384FF82A